MSYVARSLATVVDTDHDAALEATSPTSITFRVRDDGHIGDTLQSGCNGTATCNGAQFTIMIRLHVSTAGFV